MKILFLGNSGHRICDFLIKEGHEVTQILDRVKSLDGYDLIISFGYRHIIKKEVIKDHKVYNIHIALLPWNRGAHPNFWAHYDNTPHGVTIHLIDEGIDTGNIIFQKEVKFSPEEDTFQKTYNRLIDEAEFLFLGNYRKFMLGDLPATPQLGTGSIHRKKDLPDWADWGAKTNIVNYFKPRTNFEVDFNAIKR